jgi:hypothetical protein
MTEEDRWSHNSISNRFLSNKSYWMKKFLEIVGKSQEKGMIDQRECYLVMNIDVCADAPEV